MRLLSLNARTAQDAPDSSEMEIALFRIRHPEMEAPLLLSTDNTERLQDDPEVYGTRSTWGGADPETEPYLWVIASAVLPGDTEDAPASAQIVLENLDSQMVEIVRSVTSPPEIDIAIVLASSPDLIEEEHLGLQIISCDVNASDIVLTISRENTDLEPFPPGRLNKLRFPGLHT